jgi:hypothetical protein
MSEYILGYWLVEPIESVSVQDFLAGNELPVRFGLNGFVTVTLFGNLSREIMPFVVASEVVTARYLKAIHSAGNHPENHYASGCEFQPPPTHLVRKAGWSGKWDSRKWDSSSPVSGICIKVTTEFI